MSCAKCERPVGPFSMMQQGSEIDYDWENWSILPCNHFLCEPCYVTIKYGHYDHLMHCPLCMPHYAETETMSLEGPVADLLKRISARVPNPNAELVEMGELLETAQARAPNADKIDAYFNNPPPLE